MRALTVGALIVDGAAAVALVAALAFGDGGITLLDGIVLAALILGFFAALGTAMLTDANPARSDDAASLLLTGATMFDRMPEDAKAELRRHFPQSDTAIRFGDTEVDPSVLFGLAILRARRPSALRSWLGGPSSAD